MKKIVAHDRSKLIAEAWEFLWQGNLKQRRKMKPASRLACN